MESFVLNYKNINKIKGKTIQWASGGYNGGYSGIAKVNSITKTKKNPLSCEILEGDDLNYAFTEYFNNPLLIKQSDICFSDGDRFVVVKSIKS